LIPIAVTGFMVTAMFSVPTLVRLILAAKGQDTAGHRNSRLVVLLVPASAPLLIASLKMITVLAPRVWKLMNIVAAMTEGLAFWCFFKLLLSFIGGPSGDVGAALARCSPSRIWGCCMSPRVPGLQDVGISRALIIQFVGVVVVMSFVELDDVWAEHRRRVISWLDTLSLVLCVIAEIALIRAAHEPLQGRRIHAKFWTMKGLFVANTMSSRVMSFSIVEDSQVGDLCWTAETLRAAYSGAVTTAVAALTAILAGFSFMPSDVADDPSELPSETSSTGSGSREVGPEDGHP
jgi:hypothetical protein